MEQTQNVASSRVLPQTVAGLLVNAEFKTQVARALPKHMNAERLTRAALTEVRKNPLLGQCSVQSFSSSLFNAFQAGLEFGSILGQAYLIPYKDKNAGYICQLIVGYKGMIALAHRSGKIANIQAEVVREGDFFEHEYGSSPMLKHKPLCQDRPITHVYAYASIIGGGFQYVVMSKNEVDRISARSKIWQDHYAEMAKKTALRKLFKTLPISAELTRIVALDECRDQGETFDVESFEEGEQTFSSPSKSERLLSNIEGEYE